MCFLLSVGRGVMKGGGAGGWGQEESVKEWNATNVALVDCTIRDRRPSGVLWVGLL
jgi:hypothetical protein